MGEMLHKITIGLIQMWLNNGSVNELVNAFFEQITYDKDRKVDKIIILVHLNLQTFLSEITKSNNDYYKTNKRSI